MKSPYDIYQEELKKKVDKWDRRMIHTAWTIFVSMITAITITLLLCKTL